MVYRLLQNSNNPQKKREPFSDSPYLLHIELSTLMRRLALQIPVRNA